MQKLQEHSLFEFCTIKNVNWQKFDSSNNAIFCVQNAEPAATYFTTCFKFALLNVNWQKLNSTNNAIFCLQNPKTGATLIVWIEYY